MPEMHYVDSSNVESIGYDPDTRELHVQFLKSGYLRLFRGRRMGVR